MENVVAETSEWKESFERVVGTIEAFPEEAVFPVNVGTLTALLSGLGALSKIAEQREAIAEKIPDFDFVAFDALEDYARAAIHSHSRLQSNFVRPEKMCELARALVRRRKKFFAAAKNLVRQGVLDREALRRVRGVARYDVVWDLSFLLAALRNHSSVATTSALSLAEIENTAYLVSKMHGHFGTKRNEGDSLKNFKLRNKAFSLFSRTYDDARRAILLVHGAKEGTKIAPKLFRVPVEKRSALKEIPYTRLTRRPGPRTSLYVFFTLFRIFPEFRRGVSSSAPASLIPWADAKQTRAALADQPFRLAEFRPSPRLRRSSIAAENIVAANRSRCSAFQN